MMRRKAIAVVAWATALVSCGQETAPEVIAVSQEVPAHDLRVKIYQWATRELTKMLVSPGTASWPEFTAPDVTVLEITDADQAGRQQLVEKLYGLYQTQQELVKVAAEVDPELGRHQFRFTVDRTIRSTERIFAVSTWVDSQNRMGGLLRTKFELWVAVQDSHNMRELYCKTGPWP